MVQNREGLGPAERIVQTLLNPEDHMVHNRPGMVTADPSRPCGVKWEPVTTKAEEGKTVVYKLLQQGKKKSKVKIGDLWKDNTVRVDRRKVADYRPAGLFPEVAEWMYRQAVEVWKLDNEFAARWASFAFAKEHKDLKVVLAALMLVQSRKGDPERENGQVTFYDDDFRAIGEAMCLLFRKDNRHLDAKQLVRIRDVLSLPGIAAINRELGFGRSARKPFLGRWPKAVERWLRYREDNPRLLQGLVKSGQKERVKELCSYVGYKPHTAGFFETLRWRQDQAKDGRRTLAIGQQMAQEESWAGMTEQAICERIMAEKPNYKRLTSLVTTGITRAIMAAAIEAGCLSDKDLIIAMPTLDELGLLGVQDIRERVEKATAKAEDMRALNIARNVKSKEAKGILETAADVAVQKAVEEVVRNVRLYFCIDISGSMHNAIDQAKVYLEKFVQAFPLDQIHVSVFNTSGREVTIKSASERDGKKYASAATVRAAFRGISANGGTDYGAGVRALQRLRPQAGEDVIFFFVGDEEASNFDDAVRHSGLNPMAFGLVLVRDSGSRCVRNTATALKIPCFLVDNRTFEDVYAIPRTLGNLIANTPVGQGNFVAQAPRVTLVDQILQTDMLKKPVWAEPAWAQGA